MSDVPKSAMSDTHRRRRAATESAQAASVQKSCADCYLTRDFVAFRESVEERMRDGDYRMAQNEAAIAKVSGAVELIPELIDAKFESLITVLKTRDSVIRSMRGGFDIERETPRSPELKIPGVFSLRASAQTIVMVVISITLIGGIIAGGAYVVTGSLNSARQSAAK